MFGKYITDTALVLHFSNSSLYKLELRQGKTDIGRDRNQWEKREKSTRLSFEMKCTLWLNEQKES